MGLSQAQQSTLGSEYGKVGTSKRCEEALDSIIFLFLPSFPFLFISFLVSVEFRRPVYTAIAPAKGGRPSKESLVVWVLLCSRFI